MLKTLKRKIALVAVAGLGAGFVSVAPASAAVITGSTLVVGPVRVSTTDTTLDAVPYAAATITLGTTGGTYTVADASTATFDLVSAPAGGKIEVSGVAGTAGAGTSALGGGTTNIAAGAATTTVAGLALDTTNLVATGQDLIFGFKANKVGTYSGTIALDEDGAGGDGDTIALTFSFTTTGAPTSWTLAGTATTSLVSGTDTVTATLLDAAGKTTQPTTLDTLALTNTNATSFTDGTNTAVTADELAAGTIALTYTAGAAAGTNTVTVTPQGTLPGSGLAAKTLSYTVAGTVVATSVTAMTVSTPSTAVNAGTIGAADAVATVAAGTSALVVSFTHGTASAKVRFKLSGTAGTINGAAATTAQYVNVDADADGKGTLALTLGGSALIETTAVTVEQVTVANASIDSIAGGGVQATDIVITQTARAVAVGTITLSPTGNMIAKLGTATAPTETAVKVTVSDQFKGAIGAGYTVRAYRTAVDNANLLATGVTAADGTVSLTVKHATTLVAAGTETYTFQVSAPGVTPVVATATTIINYTTDGAITGLSVALSGTNIGAVTTPLVAAVGTTAATSQTVYPALVVPADGFADDVDGAQIYTAATAVADAGTTREVVTFTTTATPANSVTYSGSAGIKFLTSAPVASTTLWSAGTDTATVGDATAIHVYGTKTGLGTVTITSGGLTRTVNVWVSNIATNFHSIEVSAPTATIAGGAYATVTATVKDVFGNPVDTTGGALALTAEGAVLLGGMSAASTTDTGSAGTAIITYLGNVAGGTGKITVSNGLTTAGTAWAAGYVAPTGAAAPVLSASTAVTVTAGSSATDTANAAIKTDVATANAAVKALATQVTVLQASVATLIDSLTTQIASLMKSVSALTKAVAKLQAKK